MATTSSGIHNNNNPISSTFQKTVVCLHDWWLIKAQNGSNGKALAVGGFTSQGTTRIFSSAPIVKRYDMFTLQTADGITVLIKGYINKTRTHENGISFEVCNHFLIGFPFNWEKFNHHCVEGSIPTNILNQSDECGNFNNGESKGKFSDDNSEDPAVNFVSDASAEILDPSKIELLKIGDISKENKADLETPSKAFKNNRGDCSTESIDHIGDTLKDQTVQKFSNVSSIKNTEGKSSPHLSSIEKLRYLSNRIHAICGSKRKRSNFCDSANQDFVNNTETPAGKKSCFDKDSVTSSVDRFGITHRAILTSPNDAPRGSANCVNSNKDTAQHDASNDCLTESGSHINTVNPSETEILSVETPANCSKNLSTKDAIENSEKENLTSRNRSKVVSSFDKINGDNETSVPVGLRRSGRLRSVKEVVYRDFQ